MRIIGAAARRPGTSAGSGAQSLRVLHLDHTVDPGGAELALLRMLLNQPEWTASLILPRTASRRGLGVFSPLVQADRITITLAGPDQRPGGSREGVWTAVRTALSISRCAIAVRASCAFRSADIVHANTSRAAVIAAIACLLSRKRLVIHLRDHVDRESLGRFGRATVAMALTRASGVIATSRSTLASAERHLPATARRDIIPSAAGIKGAMHASALAPARPDVARVVMVARIDPWKGHEVLLRAFAEVFGDTRTRLVLAGGTAFGHDDHLSRLRSLAASLGIAAQVDLPGHVTDIAPLLEAADICVQASVRAEPLGQNVLQYLAAGKPTIATREGGPAEWIEDDVNGLLVPMGDVPSLAKAMRRLVEEPALRHRLSIAAGATPALLTDAQVTAHHHRFFLDCALGQQTRPRPPRALG